MLAHAKHLDRSLTYGRLGIFLDNLRGHSEVTQKLAWLVSESRQYLQRPRGPRWPDEPVKGPEPVDFLDRWNLFVPHDFLLKIERDRC